MTEIMDRGLSVRGEDIAVCVLESIRCIRVCQRLYGWVEALRYVVEILVLKFGSIEATS